MKQEKRLADGERVIQRRLMQLDVDPGHDAYLGWSEDSRIEKTARLKGNPTGVKQGLE